MSQDWTEKYRPKRLSDVVGNPKAVNELRDWAQSWNKGVPKKRVAVIMGSPGIGKTTSAEALAAEMGWGLIEMNASDQRTGDAIRSVALRGAYSNTFDAGGNYLDTKAGGRKLIVLDEADNLFGNADRGAIPAISELIKETMQPVVLIVNDFYALSKKSSAIKNDTVQISFLRPSTLTIAKVLKRIAVAEGTSITDDAIKRIAENSNGDLRAAVRDLESLCLGRDEVGMTDADQLSGRAVRKGIYDLMASIFKRSDAMGSRLLIRDVDEEPSFVMLWLDENMPYEYTDRGDLVRGYNALSRADIYLGRVSRRQYFGLWSYANDMMTSGVCVAKLSDGFSGGRYRFPGYLSKMSRSKSNRATKSEICRKLSEHMHTSTGRVASDVFPSLKIMLMQDHELRMAMIKDVGMEADELAFLMDKRIDDPIIKQAVGDALYVPSEDDAKTEKKVVMQPRTSDPIPGGTVSGERPQKANSQRSLFEF